MDRMDLAKMIGANIRKYRLLKSLSQENIALDAGMHPAYLGQLERGEKCPNIDTLLKISDALNTPICDILDFERKEVYEINENKTFQKLAGLLNQLPDFKQQQLLNIITEIIDFKE